MVEAIFIGPGGAERLYNGSDQIEAERICGQVLRHNQGLKVITAGDENVITRWCDRRNALGMLLRKV
jgi:hypothetical protein